MFVRRTRRTMRGVMASTALAVFAMAPLAAHSGQAQTASHPARIVRGFTPAPLDSGFGPLNPAKPVGITPAEIIQRFAAKETQFKRALEQYTYRRTVKVDTFNQDGAVDGEYLQTDDIVFTNSGEKHEQVVYAPENTLTRVAMSPADFDDIEHRLPFSLTTEDVGLYRVSYVGTQPVDNIPMYVFDVAPRQIQPGRRYFEGRIWVEQHDFQIVVTNGKNVPDDTRRGQEDLSVPFTTYRQQIDGKYWFPVYTRAEGTLHFENCKQCLPEDVHLREIVKYGSYKRFGSDSHILYNGLAEATPATTPVPPPAATSGATSAAGPAPSPIKE